MHEHSAKRPRSLIKLQSKISILHLRTAFGQSVSILHLICTTFRVHILAVSLNEPLKMCDSHRISAEDFGSAVRYPNNELTNAMLDKLVRTSMHTE